ncbi:retroviral integration site protein Fli-1 homolog isoform X2 [Nerophis lumbriciformis]|uniref:retroviral integration site protein Fli-1 homolog isoform X2 n=1 Tax=Nerophis lumbriciformis TaxID=546530 RepID=UPI002ADFB610|nr:retroviral integration site protein Fli-1 homolog isoform X2 [Nerophis lumbriciformis]
MDAQSDLDVILEFLEEYHRHNTVSGEEASHWGAGVQEDAKSADDTTWTQFCWPCQPHSIQASAQPPTCDPSAAPFSQITASGPTHGPQPDFVSTRQLAKHQAAEAGSGRKVRLFHFLFEMLENPAMAHCVSWVPAAEGVFRFSARNKDQLAELWGQRKGNKRPMTYQKMSRALRNYARSGEIFKVKKKLTYQFSEKTLTLLHMRHYEDVTCKPHV